MADRSDEARDTDKRQGDILGLGNPAGGAADKAAMDNHL